MDSSHLGCTVYHSHLVKPSTHGSYRSVKCGPYTAFGGKKALKSYSTYIVVLFWWNFLPQFLVARRWTPQETRAEGNCNLEKLRRANNRGPLRWARNRLGIRPKCHRRRIARSLSSCRMGSADGHTNQSTNSQNLGKHWYCEHCLHIVWSKMHIQLGLYGFPQKKFTMNFQRPHDTLLYNVTDYT